MDVPNYATPLIITDAGVNIIPTLADKRDICQNAIDLAKVLRFDEARVAILSAVENVTRKIPSTVEAAALCKMADRGQISGGLVDGPLAFDDAVSVEAAQQAHIVSPVAGKANILLVPDIESRKYAGEAAYVHVWSRRGRNRAWGACPDHFDQ